MKSQWKKRSAGLMGLLLSASMVIAGCASSNQTSSKESGGKDGDKVTLTFETSVYPEAPHKKALDALIQKYTEKNPNIEIKIHGADYENFWNKLTTEVVSGTQGDIVQVYPENISTYNSLADGGAFVNLDDYIKESELEDKLVGQELSKVDGSYYAVSSYAWGTTGIFYWKSMFEKAGINPDDIKTIDDLKEAAAKLGGKDQYGFASVVGSHPFVSSEWYRLVARPVSNGIYFPNGETGPYEAGKINVNSKENIWAAEWWQDFLADSKITAPGTRDKKVGREMFWNKQAAMNMDGPWFIGMTQERDPSLMDDLGIIPQPVVEYEGQEYKPNPTMYPLVAMISKKSKHVEEAWDFLEWMASPEAQELIVSSGMIPSNKEFVATDKYKSENQVAVKFAEFLENNYAKAVMDPPIPQQGELSQIMLNAAQDMFVGKKDAKSTMNEAAKKMEEVMER